MKTFKQIFGNELRWAKGLTPLGVITLFAIFMQALRTIQFVEGGKTLEFISTLITLVLLVRFAGVIKISKNDIEE
ncbi:hypothetical protein [Hoylesella nanceiensis]|jgi:hypothetical protein|uniref:hypothetical protein n=1 Tax=Hoylesella nanceiensis TaxID=425941 RepID=UPI0028EDC1C1|nr:hypothetical protein [Hoylesella nanceiensis]